MLKPEIGDRGYVLGKGLSAVTGAINRVDMEVIGCVDISRRTFFIGSDVNHILNGPPSVGRLEKVTSKSTPTPSAPPVALTDPLTLPARAPEAKKGASGSVAMACFPTGLFVTVTASPCFYSQESINDMMLN